MTTNTVDYTDPIAQRLCTLAQDSPYLKYAARLYEAILPILRDADIRVEPVSLTWEQARSKMEMGLPLLHDLDLELDGQSVKDLMLRIAGAVEKLGENEQSLPQGRSSNEAGAAARLIRLALEEHRLNIADLLLGIAAGERGAVTSVARDLKLDSGLLWTFAQNALKPALRAWCRQLSPLAEGTHWHRGSCFMCGADATLGELQENNQVKHLRCSRCGADWLFRRLQCSYCGNEDHMTLGYLYSENQGEKFRVEVCENCKGYLKVIAAFTPTTPEMLAVEDLATLHLDYIARESGYKKPGVLLAEAFVSRSSA
jgi:FdhE protein